MTTPALIQLENGRQVDKFKVTKKLGEGTFGAVYMVEDEKGVSHAMKAEPSGEKTPLLKLELHVMQILKECKTKHSPDLIDKGHFENFNYIVMKLLGESMQNAKKTGPDGHLSLGPAMGAGIQCLEAIEELHWAGFLHSKSTLRGRMYEKRVRVQKFLNHDESSLESDGSGAGACFYCGLGAPASAPLFRAYALRDIKPGNFAVGRDEVNELRKVFVLDFGMCRKFVNANNVMLPPRRKAAFRGTPRYAPIASHDGKEHSRKDDVESWFYMMVDFTNAHLPWKTSTEIKEVGECKKNSRNEPQLKEFFNLCPFEEYKLILTHIDSLTFFDTPDYGLIYSTLRGAMKAKGVKEVPYDWENQEKSRCPATK